MKAIAPLLLLCFLVFEASAQKLRSPKVEDKSALQKVQNADFTRSQAQELVSFPTNDDDCSDSAFDFLVTDTWGYFTGNNGFGDHGRAQVLTFETSDNYTVVAGIGYFNIPGIVNDGNLTAEVYTLDADGSPADLIIVSDPVKVSELAVPDSFIYPTVFDFPPDANMVLNDPKFLLNIDFSALYESMDTVSLYSTDEDCGSGDDTWEKWDDGTWLQYSNDDGWGANIDLFIEAVVDFPDATSSDAFIRQEGLTLHPASPNPAFSNVVLNYTVEEYDDVEIDIFDAQGKVVQQIKRNRVHGDQAEQIDLKGYSSGVYYYQVRTNDGRITSRFTKE